MSDPKLKNHSCEHPLTVIFSPQSTQHAYQYHYQKLTYTIIKKKKNFMTFFIIDPGPHNDSNDTFNFFC